MKLTHCPGCGAPFQNHSPGEPGYLPVEISGKNEPLCRRCFRLKHYGKLESLGKDPKKIDRVIQRAADKLDLAVLVVDLFDLEGSLTPHWQKILDIPVLVALNKIDLIPKVTPVAETVGIVQRIGEERLPSLAWRGTVPVSAVKQTGQNELIKQIIYYRGRHHRVGFFGATNAGKSSLLSQLLSPGQKRPITSSKPGTTQGTTAWYREDLDITLQDTPGLTPGTRLTDQLCPQCASNLVVKKRVISTYLELKPMEAFTLGAYASFIHEGVEACSIAVYPAEGIKVHSTNSSKAQELLQTRPDWLGAYCTDCASRLSFEEHQVTATAGSDIYISGLGWLAVRKGEVRLQIKCPWGVEVGVRTPHLFGKKA